MIGFQQSRRLLRSIMSIKRRPLPATCCMWKIWLLAVFLFPFLATRAGVPPSQSVHVDLQKDLSEANQLVLTGGVILKSPKQTPLIHSFEEYHLETILGMMSGVTSALRIADPNIIISGNLAGMFQNSRWVEVARNFSYLNTELDVIGAMKNPGHFLTVATLAEAAGTVNMVMPSSASNTEWEKKEDPEAYAFGTGLAYAMGAHMHIPWCLYDGSSTNRFYGSLEGHQPIFQMINRHRDFFDGYVPALWFLLKVPYGPEGIKNQTALDTLMTRVFRAGIPTLIRFCADEGALADFDGIRLTGSPVSTQVFDGQEAVLPNSVPVQLLDGTTKDVIPPLIRVSAEASTTPIVFHLLYRSQSEQKTDATAIFRINPDWLPAEKITGIEVASVRRAGEPETAVEWSAQSDGSTRVTVKYLHAWTVMRVLTREAIRLPGAARPTFRGQLTESEIPVMRMMRFDNQWNRPPWVDKALASKPDPFDGYHITRITWSYDHTSNTLNYAKDHNMAFHGSDAFLHTYMTPDGSPADNSTEIFTRAADWSGWVRSPSGNPMLIRPDWNPPRYGASFASSDYREGMITRAKKWIAKGASGIQFDDVSGMLNRVWQYGGDFSDPFFIGFRDNLAKRNLYGITTNTSLDELRQRVVHEMWQKNAVTLVTATASGKKPAGWVSVPYHATSTDYPGKVWIGLRPFARPAGRLTVEYDIRFPGTAESPHADFLLMDGDRTTYLSRFSICNGKTPQIPNNKWIPFRLQYDLTAQTFRYAVGIDGKWSEPIPFEMPLKENISSLAVAVMADPLRSGFDLRRIDAELQ